MNEEREENFLDGIKENFSEPYVRLVAGIIAQGIADCRIDYLTHESLTMRRQLAQLKRAGLYFVQGKEIEFYIHLAELDINIKFVRERLKPEFDKLEDIKSFIKNTDSSYMKQKKIEKTDTFYLDSLNQNVIIPPTT